MNIPSKYDRVRKMLREGSPEAEDMLVDLWNRLAVKPVVSDSIKRKLNIIAEAQNLSEAASAVSDLYEFFILEFGHFFDDIRPNSAFAKGLEALFGLDSDE